MSYLHSYDDGMLDALDQSEVSGVPLFADGLMGWPARWADARAIYAAETGKIKALHQGDE